MRSDNIKRLAVATFILLTAHAATTLADSPLKAYQFKLDAKFNNQDRPITVYLTKGTYQVKPIGKAEGGHEGWSVWESTNCTQAKGCNRTVPTRFTGMHNNYYVMSPHLVSASVNDKTLPTVETTPPNRDYSYFLDTPNKKAYEVAENLVYPDEASALAAAQTSTFILGESGRVQFALLDKSRVEDNRGGMTLQVRKLK